jgi:predicted Mrr-cat superfamily restriction endonuclease
MFFSSVELATFWRLEMGFTEPTRDADLDIFQLEMMLETKIVEFFSYNELSLARLVDEIFIAQGYRTQVSPFGDAGNVYISAYDGMGPLGFALPRIAALVRPIDQMADPGADELEAFKALSKSENGLFASWLCFSDETQELARRLFNQAEFWDVNGIIRAITTKYEKLSDELRASIPLKQIWILDRQKLDGSPDMTVSKAV